MILSSVSLCGSTLKVSIMACSTNEVWLGNLRPATSELDISEFLIDSGYTNFMVTMIKKTSRDARFLLRRRNGRLRGGICSPKQFERSNGTGLKMHATPMVIMRKSMIPSENQQSPAQAELYGMKHGLTTANINCRIKITQ